MAGFEPAGAEAHGILPLADADYSTAPRPAPIAGVDGVDWIVILEVDALQVPAS